MKLTYGFTITFFTCAVFLNAQQAVFKVTYDFFLDIGEDKHYESSLLFDDEKSLFHWGQLLESWSPDREDEFHVDLGANDSVGSFTYVVRDSMYSRRPYFNGTSYVVVEKIPEIPWKVDMTLKDIGPYRCQKATATFRGRDYTAWFSRDIPIRSGPWKLQGLPGLIIEIFDATGEIRFMVRSIAKSEDPITPDFRGTTRISISEYAEQQRSFSDDLVRKIMSKLPRDATIEITSKKSMEYFN